MMLKAAGAIAVILFISVAVIAVGMWRGFIPIPGPLLVLLAGAKEPEHSARYYPPDTLAYAWATLLPSGGQHDDMRDVWQRLNDYPAFVDLVDELKRELAEETAIEFDPEVASWVGPEISAGLLEFEIEQGRPVALVMVGVRDRDAAAAFLTKWRAYIAQEFGVEFMDGSHQGFDTWVDEDAQQAYALTNDWLVYATGARTLQATLDRISGHDASSLADDADFVAARAAMPERRFSSFFLDYRQGLHLFEDLVDTDFGPVMPGLVGPASFAEQTPDWLAGSTGWIERGVTVDVVMPTVPALGLETVAVQDPATLLPVDTLGFVAGAFDPEVDNWRTALREYDLQDLFPDPELIYAINAGVAEMSGANPPQLDADATLADALDLGFRLVEDLTGIDLEADFFDHLSGQAILAVRDFDFDAVADDPITNAIDAVAMLSHRDDSGGGLTNTMDVVAGLLHDHVGLEATSVDVGADDDATVFDLGFLGMMMGGPIGYRPGYVLHDRYLTLGTTQDALSTIVAVQDGREESLSSDGEYRRAADSLATGGQFLAYANVRRVVGQIDEDDVGLEPDEYRLLREGLGVVVLGSAVGEDYSRGRAVLTLFPE